MAAGITKELTNNTKSYEEICGPRPKGFRFKREQLGMVKITAISTKFTESAVVFEASQMILWAIQNSKKNRDSRVSIGITQRMYNISSISYNIVKTIPRGPARDESRTSTSKHGISPNSLPSYD